MGCAICRGRRVKCDERYPFCLRCSSTGRKCDGVSNSTPGPSAVAVSLGLNITAYAIPFKMPGGPSDRRVIHYFCVRGGRDIAGSLKADFWVRVVLQDSQHDPVVRQGLVALSLAHLEFSSQGHPGVVKNEQVTEEYVKALRRLRKSIANEKRPTRRTALICCLLFYHFESIRGARDCALGHLRNGLGILQDVELEVKKAGAWLVQDQNGEPEDLRDLTRMFAFLDMQATTKIPSHVPSALVASACRRHTIGFYEPITRFDSIEDAQIVLESLYIRVAGFINSKAAYKDTPYEMLPEDVATEKDHLVDQCRRSDNAVANLIAGEERWKEITPKQAVDRLESVKKTRLLSAILHTIIVSSVPENHVFWEGSLADQILEISSSLLRNDRQRISTSSLTQRNYASGCVVVGPLFVLAAKTKNLSVLERTIALLDIAAIRREGLIDGEETLKLTQATLKQLQR